MTIPSTGYLCVQCLYHIDSVWKSYGTYLILKHLHMTTAYITVVLFALRLLMDTVSRPEWRRIGWMLDAIFLEVIEEERVVFQSSLSQPCLVGKKGCLLCYGKAPTLPPHTGSLDLARKPRCKASMILALPRGFEPLLPP